VQILLASFAFLGFPGKVAVAQVKPTNEDQLLSKIPECSVLRSAIGKSISGRAEDQSYMELMRQNGVERALFEVQAVLHADKPEQIHIVRRLYFRDSDAPNSQISDDSSFSRIQGSGLSARLDEIARTRVLSAPIYHGVDPQLTPIKNVSSFVEFLASPILEEQPVRLTRSVRPNPLRDAVLHEDALTTRELLRSKKFSKDELGKALIYAVQSRYDNSAVIHALLNAGADVNVKAGFDMTPLMLAVDHPCNIPPLLNAKANLNARNKWGRTALQIAQQEKRPVSIRLLEEASSDTQNTNSALELRSEVMDLRMTLAAQASWQDIYDSVETKQMPCAGRPEGMWDDVRRQRFLTEAKCGVVISLLGLNRTGILGLCCTMH
jgi:hypothetical protein